MPTLRDLFTGNLPLGFNADPQYNKFSFNVNGMPFDPSMMGMMPMMPNNGTPNAGNNLTATMGKQPAGQPSTSTAQGFNSPFPTNNSPWVTNNNPGYGSFLGNSGVNATGFLANLGNSPSPSSPMGGGLRQRFTRWG